MPKGVTGRKRTLLHRRGVNIPRLVLLLLFHLGLAVVIFVFFTGEKSPEFIRRVLFYTGPDIHDYKKFPNREIKTNPPAYMFARKRPGPLLFATIDYKVQGIPRAMDFEKFLISSGTTAMIIIKDDALLYENYFNGFHRDSWFTSFAITKSFTSALIGCAIADGVILSVHDPVVNYIPELRGRGLDRLTLRHLLTMSSGINYHETPWHFPLLAYMSDNIKTYYYPDLRQLALRVKPGREPLGDFFHYNNYHSLLEGIILERATGRRVTAYLQEKIWKPLGMQYPATWSLDSVSRGFEKMESGINARAVDYAKFGRLFLKNGRWGKRQVLPENWVLESTSPEPKDRRPWVTNGDFRRSNGYYKYHWWGLLGESGRYDYIAVGRYGQYIYVSPAANAVIVRLGEQRGPRIFWPEVLKSLADRLASR